MLPTSGTTQIITPFGSGYIAEQHGDLADRNFAPALMRKMVEALTAAMFVEVRKSLSSALYLN